MKKALSLILALMMCLSLCACSGKDSKYEKYDALIDYIESNNQTGALAELNKLFGANGFVGQLIVNPSEFTESTEPPITYTEVEITLENWQEYFEITIEEHWRKNAFGEPESFSHDLVFRLKKVYADKVDEGKPAVDIEVGYEYTNYEWTVDFENQVYTKGSLSKKHPGSYKTKIINVFYPNYSGNIDTNYRSKDGTGKVVISEYNSIKVLRIQGTLLLLNS